MRKENQVISAEEKRGILKMQGEEKAKRESMIVSNFREMGESSFLSPPPFSRSLCFSLSRLSLTSFSSFLWLRLVSDHLEQGAARNRGN